MGKNLNTIANKIEDKSLVDFCDFLPVFGYITIL